MVTVLHSEALWFDNDDRNAVMPANNTGSAENFACGEKTLPGGGGLYRTMHSI